MTDVFNKKQRSQIMSKIRSRENRSTEMACIKLFKKNKIAGWRRNQKVFGNPDFVFFKQRIVVFADGCYWHGHDCKNITPKTNVHFWRDKLENNKKRDRLVNRTLKKEGWTVVRIWECEIKKEKLPRKLIFLWKGVKTNE